MKRSFELPHRWTPMKWVSIRLELSRGSKANKHSPSTHCIEQPRCRFGVWPNIFIATCEIRCDSIPQDTPFFQDCASISPDKSTAKPEILIVKSTGLNATLPLPPLWNITTGHNGVMDESQRIVCYSSWLTTFLQASVIEKHLDCSNDCRNRSSSSRTMIAL